jgi:hypothetical protein
MSYIELLGLLRVEVCMGIIGIAMTTGHFFKSIIVRLKTCSLTVELQKVNIKRLELKMAKNTLNITCKIKFLQM